MSINCEFCKMKVGRHVIGISDVVGNQRGAYHEHLVHWHRMGTDVASKFAVGATVLPFDAQDWNLARQMYATGCTYREIAEAYGASKMSMRNSIHKLRATQGWFLPVR